MIRHDHCYIFTKKSTAIQNSDSREVSMKKLFSMLENLWVAVTFAESGIYELAVVQDPIPQGHNTVDVHA